MLMPESGASNVMKRATRQAHQPRRVGREQDHGHQAEGDRGLGEQRQRGAAGSGRGRHIGDRRVGEDRAERCQHRQHAERAARELGQRVEHRVPGRDLAQTPEGQRHRRIDMRARLPPPGRVDDRDHRQAHDHAHQRAAYQAVGQRLSHRRSGIPEQRRAQAGRDHVQAEPGRLHQVFRPMPTQRIERPARRLGGAAGRALPHHGGARRGFAPWVRSATSTAGSSPTMTSSSAVAHTAARARREFARA
jgi:hypothetical protein